MIKSLKNKEKSNGVRWGLLLGGCSLRKFDRVMVMENVVRQGSFIGWVSNLREKRNIRRFGVIYYFGS